MIHQGISYGEMLPDQVDRISGLFDSHLELIRDVRDLYRDRAALEREYASKLQLLAKKATEKKNKAEASIAFGADPAKAWNVDSLKKNSLNVAYTEIVDAMSGTAQDHVMLADDFTSQVVEVFGAVEKKGEEFKKKEMQFFQKVLKDRDQVYGERQKRKQRYADNCADIESLRQKQNRAQDDKHADRTAKLVEHQRNEMLNSKNEYIISTAVANTAKTQFYDTSLPNLENQFQTLQKTLIERVVKILQHSCTLHHRHFELMKTRVNRVDVALGRVDPVKDQGLFIEHNVRTFVAPPDWEFEPCSFHYDTSEMSTDPGPKVFIQNKMSRCRSKLQQLNPALTTKRKELDQVSAQFTSYTIDHTLGTIDELCERWLEAQHQLLLCSTTEVLLHAEVKIVVAAIGDNQGALLPHTFKNATFSLPAQCAYCKNSIWGLSKQGKNCKSCGISVHAKCELKVPAECGQVGSTSSRTSKDGSPVSCTSSRVTSSVSGNESIIAPILRPSTPEDSKANLYPSASVLYDFSGKSEFELQVSEGDVVHVIEPDDGSGWVKVVDEQGNDGFVPASYLQIDVSTELP